MNYPAAGFVVFLLVAVYVTQRQKAHPSLPPGPPSHPVIGHLLRMPYTQTAEVFRQWARDYGEFSWLDDAPDM